MLIGTHVLLPVCLGLVAENVSLTRGRGAAFPEWTLPVVGLFGALPDLCTPHLSLEARFSSWSHTVWFLLALIPICSMTAACYPKDDVPRCRVAIACWLAAVLHIGADAVSGGIAWLHPWKADVIGSYFIPASHWLGWDIGFVVITWALLRLRPHAAARGLET